MARIQGVVTGVDFGKIEFIAVDDKYKNRFPLEGVIELTIEYEAPRETFFDKVKKVWGAFTDKVDKQIEDNLKLSDPDLDNPKPRTALEEMEHRAAKFPFGNKENK